MPDYMASKSNYVILILAAGSSTRMGKPKQLLKWKDSNFLNHTINTALKLNVKEVVVVLGANADIISPEVNSKKVSIVVNKEWSKGIGSSISEGIRYFKKTSKNCDAVLIMLCDQPLIDSEHYQNLLINFKPGQEQIIATKYKKEELGVPALFDRTYFDDLEKLQGDFGAKKIIKKYSNNVKLVENITANFDIDTPEQYKNLT